VIVVDASALVAIGDEEDDADAYLQALSNEDAVLTDINYVETGIILIGRRRLATQADVNRWLTRLAVTVHSSESLAVPALEAYLTYGRRFHRAGLNLGDCFAYALAKKLNAPLLYKGSDFAITDVESALQPT
jgi:ribonuclease VapC